MSMESLGMSRMLEVDCAPSRYGNVFCAAGSHLPSVSESVVVTIGAFDGVHVGHRALVESAIADARRRGVRCMAMTFDPDPADVVEQRGLGKRLMRIADRRDTLLRMGADFVYVISFTPVIASREPEDFVQHMLMQTMRPVSVHVGSNFRFGREGLGDVYTLKRLGERYGFDVAVHDLLKVGEERVSSSRIRRLLKESRLEDANALLGHSHFVRGHVIHGRGEGTSFGFPTANVECESDDCMPSEGVYACYVVHQNEAWPAAANVGSPPTFLEARPAFLEASLIGFSGDLYGAEVTVFFERWLRASRVFSSLDELERVVLENISWVRHNLGSQALEV